MQVVGVFSFNKGKESINLKYPHLLEEIYEVISEVNAAACKSKKSKEKTMPDRLLYSPRALNCEFKSKMKPRGWRNIKIVCDYSTGYYTEEYTPKVRRGMKPFREMDFVKDKLGIEVQFGKYAFMVYNVAAKMTIFRNLNIIDMGVEIVPIKEFADEMSTGVSYFEQFVWDLETRGTSNIDIPVLILGITK